VTTQSDLLGAPYVIGRCARVTGLASGLDTAVVHFRYRGERSGAYMAKRALIAWQPGKGCWNMGSMPALDSDIDPVVTSLATRRSNVIEGNKRRPVRSGMAGIAARSCWNMICKWLVIHFRISAQVTIRACPCRHPGMAIRGDQRHPGASRAVTNAAGFGSRDMQHRLLGSRRAVMAIHARLAGQLCRGMCKTGR